MSVEPQTKTPRWLSDITSQSVVGYVLGVVFCLAGAFGPRDWRLWVYLAAVLAFGASLSFAARTKSTWLAAGCGASAAIAAFFVFSTLMTREPLDPSPIGHTATSTSEFTVTFEQPRENAEVPLTGTTASGSIAGEMAVGQSLWFAISSEQQGGGHHVLKRLETVGSSWSASTGQVGIDAPSDVGGTFRLEVVLADSEAERTFETAGAAPKEGGWSELPKGATVVATRRVVREPEPLRVNFESIEPADNLPGISAKMGLQATGVARGLKLGETLWLMDKDDVGYSIAGEVTMVDYRWSAHSAPLGDENDSPPFKIAVSVVKADQKCDASLRAEMDRKDGWLATLPKGCVSMDTESIAVTRP